MENIFNEFNKNSTPSLVHYTTMMNAYIDSNQANSALSLYDQIVKEQYAKKFQLDHIFHTIAIKACLKNMFSDQAYDYDDMIQYNKMEKKAKEIFSYMKSVESSIKAKPNTYTYATMIKIAMKKIRTINHKGKMKQGDIKWALSLWQGMLQAKIKPDKTVYTAMIHALAQSNNLIQAIQTIDEMKHQAKINIDIGIYNGLCKAIATYIKKSSSNFNILKVMYEKDSIKPNNITIQSIYKGLSQNSSTSIALLHMIKLYQRIKNKDHESILQHIEVNQAMYSTILYAISKHIYTYTPYTEFGLQVYQDALDAGYFQPKYHDVYSLLQPYTNFIPIIVYHILNDFKQNAQKYHRGIKFIVGKPIQVLNQDQDLVLYPSIARQRLDYVINSLTPRLYTKQSKNNQGIVYLTYNQLKTWKNQNKLSSIRPSPQQILKNKEKYIQQKHQQRLKKQQDNKLDIDQLYTQIKQYNDVQNQ